MTRTKAPKPAAPHPPLAERGRMLSVDDVLQLLPRKATGEPTKSRYWVLTAFLPERKHHLGRTPWWWENEVRDYLDSTLAATEDGAA